MIKAYDPLKQMSWKISFQETKDSLEEWKN
jgi:hypothetical protein